MFSKAHLTSHSQDLHDPDNHDGVISHLEPDILEFKVKWALTNITTNKASGGDGIPAELFQIWQMMLWKCSTQYASKFGKLSSGHRTGKGVFIPIPKKGNAKEYSNYHTIALISHASKVMLNILQARFQQYVQMFKLNFKKTEEPEIKLPASIGEIEKAREFHKNTYFCFID